MTAEARLHVESVGEGPAVLWIHGYTMDATIWRGLWALLPGMRHVGIDLPGHGRSGSLDPALTLPELAGQVAAVARTWRARRIVALSFGCCVALQVAMDHPELVDRLVVGAPAVGGAPAEPGTARRHRELMLLARMGARPDQLAELWMRSPPDIFLGTERHPELRAALRAVIARHSWAELATGGMARLTSWAQPAEALAAIAARTLVVIGSEDMPTFAANASLLADRVADCAVLRVPNAGHLCLIERPGEVAGPIASHLAADA